MQEALQQQFVERAAPAEPHAKLRVILETQRAAFLRAGAPSLEERRADLARLGGAIRHESGRIADTPELRLRSALRAVVEEHRARGRDATTLSGLVVQVDQLRRSLEAVAAKVRRHEETIRRLERARREPG